MLKLSSAERSASGLYGSTIAGKPIINLNGIVLRKLEAVFIQLLRNG